MIPGRCCSRGTCYSATVEDEREKRLRAATRWKGGRTSGLSSKSTHAGYGHLHTGQKRVRSIHKGEVLAVLESMKMQNELRSPRDGKVIRVRIKPGDRVEQKETILSVV